MVAQRPLRLWRHSCCLSWLPTEKACSQRTPVNVFGLSLAWGCAVIAGKVPLHVTTHFHACSLYLQWIIDLWDGSCSPFPCQHRIVPSHVLKTSHFSWETVIQTDHSSLHALYPENCIKDLKALMCFDKKGMLFLGASRSVQPTTSLFTDEWLLDVSHLFFRLLWTNNQCRGLHGTCSEIRKACQGVQEACVWAGHIQHFPLMWKAMCCQNSPFSVSGPLREQRQEQRPSFTSTNTWASHHSSHYYQNACKYLYVQIV